MSDAIEKILKRTERRTRLAYARAVLNAGVCSLQKVIDLFNITPDETAELLKGLPV